MKKVLITHVQNTLNYGSAMMAINLLTGLRHHLPKASIELYCECDEYHLNRLIKGTGDDSLKRYTRPREQINSKVDVIKKYFFGKDVVIDSIGSMFDTMIVLGGDDLSETYMKGAIFKGAFYHHLNKRCQVILAGQSLGPFSGIYLSIASLVFRNLVITTRDDNSYAFTRDALKVKNLFQGRDLALLPLPRQEHFSQSDSVQFFSGQEYIVVVPSGLSHRYTDNTKGYIERWSEIIRELHTYYPHSNIVMLSHVLYPPHSDDSVIIQRIYDGLEDTSYIDTVTQRLQPAEARAILGGARLVVTGRMHAAVSTYFMRKPAIALAYSEKYDGVIAKGLQLPQLIVDCRDQSWGSESTVANKVIQKVVYIENNYSELIKTIDAHVLDSSRMIEGQIEYIAQKVVN